MKKAIGIGIGIVGVLLAVFGIIFKVKQNIAVSVIGGADGPTSIFVAGKVGGDVSAFAIVAGIVLIVVCGILLFKKKR